MSGRVVVLGSDANALVAAHYIALSDREVVLVHDRAFPDVPTLDTGWIPPRVVRDLDLHRYGLQVEAAETWASVGLPGGERLQLTRDVARTAEALRRLSTRDGARWPEFCERMHVLARFLESIYTAPPPDPLTRKGRSVLELVKSAVRVRGLGRRSMEDLFRLASMSAADWLDEWFESDALKGALGAAGVYHLAQGPRAGGTAFNLLHHHVGNPPGVFRPQV